MRNSARTVLGAIVAGSLLASSGGAQAWTRRDTLFAGALAGATMGVFAGSAFAGPPPPPVYVYRPRPAWHGYPPPRIEIDDGDGWADHADDDWDD